MESPIAIRVLTWQATVYKQVALNYYEQWNSEAKVPTA